jgi:hypothetical protein
MNVAVVQSVFDGFPASHDELSEVWARSPELMN